MIRVEKCTNIHKKQVEIMQIMYLSSPWESQSDFLSSSMVCLKPNFIFLFFTKTKFKLDLLNIKYILNR